MFTIKLDNGDEITAYKVEFDHYEESATIQLDFGGEQFVVIPIGSIDVIEW